jgi:hypothetical protein
MHVTPHRVFPPPQKARELTDNKLTFLALGFLAGVILTFAACSPEQQPRLYQPSLESVQ